MVDIAGLWAEVRGVFARASKPVVYAIEDMESSLPFVLLGYDADNGGEVLNQHIVRYFRDERLERNRPPVQVTRSREHHKNDNAHVAQRNDSVPRKWLGYERIDFVRLAPLINNYYAYVVCPLINHFFPSFKLYDKVRVKSRTRRIYKDPLTPSARLMASEYLPQQRKNLLNAHRQALNPVKLIKEKQVIRKRIDDALKNLRQGKLTLISVPSPKPAALSHFPQLNNDSGPQLARTPLVQTDTALLSATHWKACDWDKIWERMALQTALHISKILSSAMP